MRYSALLLSALAVAVCSCEKNEDQANVPADTVATAAAPAAISLNDVKGTWDVRAMAADKDSVLTTYRLWASDDTSQWKMKFDNRPDTIKVNVIGIAGDSVMVQVGPYSSALRKNVKVFTQTIYRLEGDRLVGRSVAHYSVTTPDSVLHVRTEGRRAQ
jgi:hypothetical protein